MKIKLVLLASVVLLATLSGGPARAASRPAPHDVTVGIPLERAWEIAVGCLAAVTGAPRKAGAAEGIRPDDPLKFHGVTDDFYLGALRRYITHNTECGVRNVLGQVNRRWTGPASFVVRPTFDTFSYLMADSALDDVDGETTIAQLAVKIAESAGLPVLPAERAAQIAADCRYLTLANKPPPTVITPRKKGAAKPKPPDVPSTTVISADLKTPEHVTAFVTCVAESEKVGAASAGVTLPHHTVVRYRISDGDRARIETDLNAGQTYAGLVASLVEKATAPIPAALAARAAVLGSLREELLVAAQPTRAFTLASTLREANVTSLTATGGEETSEAELRKLVFNNIISKRLNPMAAKGLFTANLTLDQMIRNQK